MKEEYYKLIILGSGPAGYTAAIYTARANLKPVIISGLQPGGQLTLTEKIDNWPGENNGINGFELMENLKKQAQRFKTKIIYDHIIETSFKKKKFKLIGNTKTYYCNALIIATGANPKYLGIKSEIKFIGKGVSTCATCDGFFYKNKTIAIVGGGNNAIEETIYLSNIVNNITIIHRRKKITAEKILIQNFIEKIKINKINFKWNCITEKIIGDGNSVKEIKIKNIKTKLSKILKINGIFIAIGQNPNTKIFKKQLKMINNYLSIKSGLMGNVTQTNKKGIFAAGDVVDNIYRQAITSAGFGCMAALDAEKFLEKI